jgi:DNA polymerase III subunit epsilon
MNEIFLDTETTGLSPNDGHKIIEIACIETNDLTPTKRIFHKIINPQRDVPQEAFKIHGFSTESLKDKETFDKIADEFVDFIKDKKIIIHNASFDLRFLNYELKLIQKKEIKKDHVVDSLEVARGKYPGTSNSLDALCRKFGIDLSRRTKHNALLDCELLREVYINLLDVKEPKFIFSNENLNIDIKNNIGEAKNYCKTVIAPTAEEAKLHKEFLKKELKKNYY